MGDEATTNRLLKNPTAKMGFMYFMHVHMPGTENEGNEGKREGNTERG